MITDYQAIVRRAIERGEIKLPVIDPTVPKSEPKRLQAIYRQQARNLARGLTCTGKPRQRAYAPRPKLVGMTDEQKRLRRSQMAKDWRMRKKAGK